ncbi:MAG: hypothetical protein NC302_10720 [Bacteroidales bacterium]|nr:hypothetical protein [Bacteroidales bacterium]MCM1415078.1 hypothetical protein [bacterium]MCM1424257.1 hypothetical protein [bacterium]
MKRGKRMALLLLTTALLAAGCGDEAVHTSAEAENAADAEADAVGEMTGENDTSVTSESAGTDVLTVEPDGSFPAPVEMDETLRTELTEELLTESEMDTSVVESAPVTKGCSFTLPEDFAESEDIEGMYVTKRYPIDASTIYYVALGRDVALQLMTEETFKAQAEENFEKDYGEKIEVVIDSFERMKIDGCPAFRILCHYQVGDTEITQLEYAINADKSYVITYSQTADYDRMEEYEASAETIRLEF